MVTRGSRDVKNGWVMQHKGLLSDNKERFGEADPGILLATTCSL